MLILQCSSNGAMEPLAAGASQAAKDADVCERLAPFLVRCQVLWVNSLTVRAPSPNVEEAGCLKDSSRQ